MKLKCFVFGVILLLAMVLLAACGGSKEAPKDAGAKPAAATDQKSDVEKFYSGKTITITVGATESGGYTNYARIFSKFFSNNIPGKPNVIVRSMDGGGSLVAANYAANVAPKDGTEIVALIPNIILTAAIGGPEVKFDSTKMNWLGSLNDDTTLVITRSDAPVKKFEDAFTTEVSLGVSGQASAGYQHLVAMNKLLGTKFKIVSGYGGGGETDLAIEQNEIQGRGGITVVSLLAMRPEWLKGDPPFIHPLVQMGLKRHPKLAADVPMAIDYAKNDHDKAILTAILSPQQVGRPYALPPDVPKDRVEAIQQAFINTTKDPEFLKAAEQAKLELSITNAEDMLKIVKSMYTLSDQQKSIVKDIISPPKTK